MSKKQLFSKNFKKTTTKKMVIPIWMFWGFLGVAVLALVLLIVMSIESEKDAAVTAYKETEYLKSASLGEIQELALKKAYFGVSQMAPFIFLLLGVGAAFGLANGVCLVRVSK